MAYCTIHGQQYNANTEVCPFCPRPQSRVSNTTNPDPRHQDFRDQPRESQQEYFGR